ncbi:MULTISPECIES: hypothetical protein [Bacillus]|uniref:hypothetical protein n=1 Tax=Bacillus TaxID=1386 RepID=UPI00215AA0C6|nr:hypothetical protein [Bacillus pseudomycoides]MCR8859152.1 hypothetical protein [Bacillus pseudomycoides]
MKKTQIRKVKVQRLGQNKGEMDKFLKHCKPVSENTIDKLLKGQSRKKDILYNNPFESHGDCDQQNEIPYLNHKVLKKIKKLYKDSEYTISDQGHLCIIKNKETVRLCNLIILPVVQEIITDGINEEKQLELVGVLNNEKRLPNIKVRLEEFKNSNWIENKWGIECVLYPENKCYEKIRCAIKIACKGIETKMVYKNIGWSQLEGGYFYVHGGGVIGRKRSPYISDSLQPFNLIINEDMDEVEAYKKSLKLLEVSHISVTLPLLCFTLLSKVNTLLKLHNVEPKFVLWLHGPTGSRKTTLASLFFNIFNRNLSPEIPANFKDTKTALELKMFEYKDCTLLVDDYHPTDKLSEKKDMENKAEFILRMYGDRISKSRSNIHLTKQRELMTRGLCAITAEDSMGIKSNIARCISIPIDKDSVNLDRLTKCQKNPLAFPTMVYNFLNNLTLYINKTGILPNVDLNKFREKYRETKIHFRLIESVWALKYACFLYLRYGVELGVIKEEEMRMKLNQAENLFMQLVSNQHVEMDIEDPLRMYLNTVDELIASNKMPLSKIGEDIITQKYGWYDNRYYYLLPELTYSNIFTFWQKRNKVFPLTMRKLHELLEENGIIEIDKGSGKKCPKVTISKGQRVRLLKINRKNLERYLNKGGQVGL